MVPETIDPIRPTQEWQKQYVNEAYQLRGMLLGSYAHIEYLLADICLRVWQMPGYRHLGKPFPYSIETRMKEARAIFHIVGQFEKYGDDAEVLLGDLLKYEELRHFMAHGLMVIDFSDPSDPIIEFSLYRPTKAGAEIGFIRWSFEGMRETTQEIADYGSKWTRFFYKIHREQGFGD